MQKGKKNKKKNRVKTNSKFLQDTNFEQETESEYNRQIL